MYHVLNVETRDSKAQIRPNQLRRKGIIPAVLFGKGMESLSLKINEGDLRKCLGTHAHILEIMVDGKTKHLVSLDTVQTEPLSEKLIHVAFHKVKQDEATVVELPFSFSGTAPGIKEGGVVGHQMNEIEVEGLPADIPESIEVDLSGLTLGEAIFLKDVKLPKGIKIYDEDLLEQAVVTCSLPRKEKEPEPVAVEAIEGAEGQAPAEGAAAAPAPEKKEE